MGPYAQPQPEPELPALGMGKEDCELGVFVFQICDIAINWAGGLHHAKKFEVSEEMMGETMTALG